MNVRIYVTLFNPDARESDFKKLMIMVDGSAKISMLKRKIEQEFSELFPREKPFIASKIEDQYGYSLSNNSLVSELLKTDDKIVALPESQTGGFVAGNDTNELLSMLSNMQESISGKLLDCGLSSFSPIKSVLFSIFPLCFSNNQKTMHNACKGLVLSIHEGTLRLFDEAENADVLNLCVTAVHYLITEYMEYDTEVQRSVVDLLDVLTRSKAFLSKFRTGFISQKLVSSSRSMTSSYKSKLIRIISYINRGDDWQDIIEAPKPERELRSQEKYKPPSRDTATKLGDSGMGSMVSDFILMLSPSNTSEMICFALHSLENFVSDSVDLALKDSELFSKLLNLAEISTPSNFQTIQSSILSALGSKLTVARAEEIVQKNGITRLLKSYINASPSIQSSILQLFESTIKLGKKKIDVPSLISVSVCAYPNINVLGMEALAAIADPADGNFSDEQFENHVKFFVNASVNEKQGERFKNAAAGCLAGLSLREYLRPQIIYCGGIDALIMLLRQGRVEGQRMAAKGLVNLTATKRELKMKVVAELSDEIKKLYRNELDGIVSTYLQALVSGRSS